MKTRQQRIKAIQERGRAKETGAEKQFRKDFYGSVARMAKGLTQTPSHVKEAVAQDFEKMADDFWGQYSGSPSCFPDGSIEDQNYWMGQVDWSQVDGWEGG